MINNKKIIISFTTWEKRLMNFIPVINSILEQDIEIDSIECNLSTEEFPEKIKSLPCDIQDFISNNNKINLNWVVKNTGVFKKIIPTINKYINEKEYYLFSIDDDWIYSSNYCKLMIDYLDGGNYDSFCLANANVIGNRMVYKSSCFNVDFCEKLTDDVIATRIDDYYIEYYLLKKNKNLGHFRPDNVKDITIAYNQINPNSSLLDGGYCGKNIIMNMNKVKEINF